MPEPLYNANCYWQYITEKEYKCSITLFVTEKCLHVYHQQEIPCILLSNLGKISNGKFSDWKLLLSLCLVFVCECGQKVHVYVQSNVIEYSKMFWNMHMLSHVHGDFMFMVISCSWWFHVQGDLKDFSRLYILIILQTLQLVLTSSCCCHFSNNKN